MSSMRYRAYRHSLNEVRIADEDLSLLRLKETYEHVVLVEPHFVGVCSADIREIRGERPGRRDFGHEVVGTVLDSTHEHYAAGDRVVFNPFTQIERETAFSELMYLAGSRDALASALLHVPAAGIEFSVVEPLACAIHAARKTRANPEQPRLIVGAGFFGYLLYCYLQFSGVRVSLANRTPDRLEHLRKLAGNVSIATDLEACAGRFSTVFLMQARLTRPDVTAAIPLLCNGGEIVLFGAIDPAHDAVLYKTRNLQQRNRHRYGEKTYHIQGTLDASPEDLQEAIRVLSQPPFRQAIHPIFAQPLTFKEGATHLAQRALSPRSYQKYVVRIKDV
jgi:cyclitol reductase